MNLCITPTRLSGSLTVPSSKSMSHRLVIAAALASGESRITNLSLSEDITATLNAVKVLGARWQLEGDTATISRQDTPVNLPLLDCGESGSTLRFLIPVALVLTGGASFTGRGRLMERPLTPYFQIFGEKGISWEQNEHVLTFKGTLKPGCYEIDGGVSSQFITGLLLALPLLDGDSEIRATGQLESRPYLDMTLSALEAFGIQVKASADCCRFEVPGGQQYRAASLAVEGDYSQAAFFLTANFIGASVCLQGLSPRSSQGDRVAGEILSGFAQPEEVTVDCSQIPDLVPALAVAAAFRPGSCTRFVRAGRLRIKESDRIATTAAMLRALGGQVAEEPEGLTVWGQEKLCGNAAPVDCANDHRIAMAAAAASVGCENPVTLLGAACVKKSYPRFWEDFQMLGGQLKKV